MAKNDKKVVRDKILAYARDPIIEAAAYGLFRFPDKKLALEKLEGLRTRYVVPVKKFADVELKTEDLILWVRGFKISEDEKDLGYEGNFVRISVIEYADSWTLLAEKIPTELKNHPQRRNSKDHKHPNWGHPIMRTIRKGRKFQDIEEADSQLRQLHAEFPETTIPGPNKLILMVYARTKGQSKDIPPIEKWIFKIENTPDGEFVIKMEENKYKGRIKVSEDGIGKAPPKKKVEQEDKESKGFYTSMVALRKNKKK
jgi:hypothetical protein